MAPPVEDPTPGEISRRFDSTDRRLTELITAVAKLPTSELIDARMGRIADRVDVLERALTDLRATSAKAIADASKTIDDLSKAIADERDSRKAAIDAEEKARDSAIRSSITIEKAKVGLWVRYLLTGTVVAVGTALAKAFGLVHVG